jgi:D-3-phosphoglycerate dehydrogenase
VGSAASAARSPAAAQAFGMRVLAFDPYLAPSRAKAMQIESVSMDELLAQSTTSRSTCR